MVLPHPRSTLFPYTTLFRSLDTACGPVALLCGAELWRPGPIDQPLQTRKAVVETFQNCLGTGTQGAVIAYASLVATGQDQDRKSTRLNSSHPSISYAVFCLK